MAVVERVDECPDAEDLVPRLDRRQMAARPQRRPHRPGVVPRSFVGPCARQVATHQQRVEAVADHDLVHLVETQEFGPGAGVEQVDDIVGVEFADPHAPPQLAKGPFVGVGAAVIDDDNLIDKVVGAIRRLGYERDAPYRTLADVHAFSLLGAAVVWPSETYHS